MAPVIPSVDLDETYLSNSRGEKVTVEQAGTWPNSLSLRERAGIEVITAGSRKYLRKHPDDPETKCYTYDLV